MPAMLDYCNSIPNSKHAIDAMPCHAIPCHTMQSHTLSHQSSQSLVLPLLSGTSANRIDFLEGGTLGVSSSSLSSPSPCGAIPKAASLRRRSAAVSPCSSSSPSSPTPCSAASRLLRSTSVSAASLLGDSESVFDLWGEEDLDVWWLPAAACASGCGVATPAADTAWSFLLVPD